VTQQAGNDNDNTPSPRLILASRSSRRHQLLRDAGYEFEFEPADIDETNYPSQLTPSEVPLYLARAKAKVVADRHSSQGWSGSGRDVVILAADTIIVFGDTIIGQPADAGDAHRIVQLLSGTTHLVISGVVVTRPVRGFNTEARVMSAVRMKVLTPGQIERHVASGLWQGKAGGYGIQDGNPFVERVGGCHTNIIGLPMTTTRRLLSAAGIHAGA
jgi:septum formation protein